MNQMLKKIRIEHGYKQEDVAKAIGYRGKSGYSMLENEKVQLTINKAKKLADFYGVTIEKILNV